MNFSTVIVQFYSYRFRASLEAHSSVGDLTTAPHNQCFQAVGNLNLPPPSGGEKSPRCHHECSSLSEKRPERNSNNDDQANLSLMTPIPDINQKEIASEVKRLELLYGPSIVNPLTLSEGHRKENNTLDNQDGFPSISHTCTDQVRDAQSQNADNSLNFQITLRPSDPDFDSDHLLPSGLQILLKFFYVLVNDTNRTVNGTKDLKNDSSNPLPSAAQSTLSLGHKFGSFKLTSTIDIMNPKMPNLICETLQMVYKRALSESNNSAYHALKHIDRSLVQVFEFCQKEEAELFYEYLRQFGPLEWTSEEQNR